MTSTFDPWKSSRQEAIAAGPAAFRRWQHAQDVAALQPAANTEPQGADILYAMYLCTSAALEPPSWLQMWFTVAYHRAKHRGEFESWDDVFGRPWPKGTHLARVRERKSLAGVVRFLVYAFVTERPDESLADEWGRIADDAGHIVGGAVGERRAQELYAEDLASGAPSHEELREVLRSVSAADLPPHLGGWWTLTNPVAAEVMRRRGLDPTTGAPAE